MWTDPIIKEVHQARQRLWDECGADWGKYLDRMRSHRASYITRLISPEELRRQQEAAKNSPEQPVE